MRNVNKGSAALDKKAGEQGVHTPHTYTHGTRRQDQGTHTYTHTLDKKAGEQGSQSCSSSARDHSLTHSLIHTN